MSFKSIVSISLTKLRKENNRSANSLAKQLSTDTKQIWRLENNKVNCRIDTIEKYAAAIGFIPVITFEKIV